MLRSDKAKICLAICEDGVTLTEEEEEEDDEEGEGEGGGVKGDMKDEGTISILSRLTALLRLIIHELSNSFLFGDSISNRAKCDLNFQVVFLLFLLN
jgi:hypothetical protein